MMAGSHVVLSVAAWMVVAPHLGLPAASPASLAVAVAGGLLPDIDHPNSWVGRRVRPVSSMLAALFGHRGMTHSALAVVGCLWLALHGLGPRWAAVPLAIGYASHLAGDLLTARGLRLAWPLRGTWALPLCRTGSSVEFVVVTLLFLLACSDVAGIL